MHDLRPNIAQARRRAVTSMLATTVVQDVAVKLAPRGIQCMPVKGALLQHWLYADPAERAMTDVDILVRPRHMRDAGRVLVAAGYRHVATTSMGAVVFSTPFGLELDLHPRLFDRARYRFATGGLFARGFDDERLFGARVRLPSTIDAYAHLIGKFGSDHLDARAQDRLEEIRRLGAILSESAPQVASHLVECGMGRVARYVLTLTRRDRRDSTSEAVARALPPDPIGDRLSDYAVRFLAGRPSDSRPAAFVAHMLNASVPRGFVSGGRAVVANACVRYRRGNLRRARSVSRRASTAG